ncbi:MAG: hypothetical protein ACMUEM_00465 [Flavobacteriales bacterium AspAUS03]
MTNKDLSNQNSGTGVNRHLILDSGIALLTAQAFVYMDRTEDDTLVDFHMIADLRTCTDDDTRTMVDNKDLIDPR